MTNDLHAPLLLNIMKPERWQQIDELFHSALECEPSQRALFLERACGDDEALRREVESLIMSHDQGQSFMEAPASDVAAELLAVGQAKLEAGRSIGPYRIISPLGAGGMGEVYLAQDTRLARRVALKLLPPQFTQDPDRLRRFEQEARAASALNHPGIITIHEIGRVNDLHFIATEFVDGQTLHEQMAGTRMKVGAALDVAMQAAAALSAAHEAGIVHRDIKPENIMLRRDGYIKILDFGLAKLAARQAPIETGTSTRGRVNTQVGMVMGTAYYMSPEQASGQDVDARSDIFSLGVVLYEMVTGCKPFEGSTTSHVIVSIVEKEPDPLARSVPEVPAELQRIVSKALAKARAERYQAAKDLMIDLKSLKQELELQATLGRLAPEATGMTSAGQTLDKTEKAIRRDSAQVPPLRRAKLWIAAGAFAAILALLAGLNIEALRQRFLRAKGAARIQSVAVLPLENLTGDAAQEYFADGMTDALITDLARISSLRVISRTSVMQYKGARKPLSEIARELDVDALLEGSVVRSGSRVRINAQLVQAVPERHLWANAYERDLADILALQADVARAVATEIAVKLTPQEHARLAEARRFRPEAYEAYLLGRYFWNKRNPGAVIKSIEYFEQATRKDPSYAPAYAGLAEAYSLLGRGAASSESPKEAGPKARAAAKKAVDLDDTLAEAHAALGLTKFWYDWDFPGAEKEFQRAIGLNPSYATAYQWYAQYLLSMGRLEEAFERIKRARQLDPVSPNVNDAAGDCFERARQFDRALEQYQRSLELDPHQFTTHTRLARLYAHLRKYGDSLRELQKAEEISPGSDNVQLWLGYVYAVSGKRAEAERIVADLKRKKGGRPVYIAGIYAGLGRKEEFFQWLERAYEDRDPRLVLLNDPIYDYPRSDPRFKDLVRRVGLPVEESRK